MSSSKKKARFEQPGVFCWLPHRNILEGKRLAALSAAIADQADKLNCMFDPPPGAARENADAGFVKALHDQRVPNRQRFEGLEPMRNGQGLGCGFTQGL
jgi:hypothetical protein